MALVGNTYPYREQIKEIPGTRWYPQENAWIVPSERWTEADDIVALSLSQSSRPKEKKCGICRLKGHDRRSCKAECPECKETGHSLEDCPSKKRRLIREKVALDPNFQRMKTHPQKVCYCREDYICPPCQYFCCEKALSHYCYCTCSFSCREHCPFENGGRCYGNHD